MKPLILILFCFLSLVLHAGNNKTNKQKEAMTREWLGHQPLEFTENMGQFIDADGKPANQVLFKASSGNIDIYITTGGLSYVFKKYEVNDDCSDNPVHKTMMVYRMDMNLEGAAIDKANALREEESRQGSTNYFYPHCPGGIFGVKSYGKITFNDIYPGIDWVINTNPNSKQYPLKYDFVIHPQGNYRDIRIKFVNAQNTSLTDNHTKLKIESIAGTIEEGRLFSYQADRNEKNEIISQYVINADNSISFTAGDFDKTKTLVIDPLVWATYYGGTGDDEFNAMSIDSQDNVYITGLTYQSPDFPVLQLTGAYWQPASGGSEDGIILKFDKHGVRQWATYYGGTDDEIFFTMCTDSQDNIYVSGCTTSSDFPTQQLAGAYWQTYTPSAWDLCIVKFNSQGIRQWATFYGGTGNDFGRAMCTDSRDHIYITGETDSHDLPVQQLTGAYWQPVHTGTGSDPYLIEFDDQCARVWATYFGGNNEDRGFALTTDSHDNFYLTGYTFSTDFPVLQMPGAYWQSALSALADVFIARFNEMGVLQWSTFYGGMGNEYDYGVCTDSQDNAYFVGTSSSSDFPVQQMTGAYWQGSALGNSDIYILKFDPQGARQWCTLYGSYFEDNSSAISIDGQGNIYVTGNTTSPGFPLQQATGEYWQPNLNGSRDMFMLKFDQLGARQWATFYGGTGRDYGNALAIDSKDSVYFAGESWDSGAYTTNPGNGAYYDDSFNGSRDGIILKVSPPSTSGLPGSSPITCDILSSPIPNPARDYTRIDYHIPDGAGWGEMVFYEVLGKEVNRLKLNPRSSSIQVRTDEFKAGIYYYTIKIAGREMTGKKLVVIH